MKKSWRNYFNVLALPWCCVLPVSIAFFGFASGALGSYLSSLTPLFLIISIILISYSNYNVWIGDFRTFKHRVYVSIITIVSILLWLWSFSRMGWI